MPSAAKVEYADAMSRTLISLLPSTADGYGLSGPVTPSLWAMSMAFCGPTSWISWA